MTDPLTIIEGCCLQRLAELPESSVHCCVTSPPYWGLRDYGAAGQIGLEASVEEYVARMVEVTIRCIVRLAARRARVFRGLVSGRSICRTSSRPTAATPVGRITLMTAADSLLDWRQE